MDVAIHESANKIFSLHAEDVEVNSTASEINPSCKHEQKCSKNNIRQLHVHKRRRCLREAQILMSGSGLFVLTVLRNNEPDSLAS